MKYPFSKIVEASLRAQKKLVKKNAIRRLCVCRFFNKLFVKILLKITIDDNETIEIPMSEAEKDSFLRGLRYCAIKLNVQIENKKRENEKEI